MNRRVTAAVLRAACYVLTAGFLAHQLWQARHGLADDLRTVGTVRAVCAGVAALAGVFVGMLGWRLVLAGLGTRLRLAPAAKVYFVGGLGKYLPGGVWPALGHADLGRAMGLPAPRLAGAFFGSVALSVLSGAAVGLLVLPRLAAAEPAWWALVPLLSAAVLPFAVRPLGAWLAGAASRVLPRRFRLPLFPARPVVVRAVLLMLTGWLVSGAHLVVLAGAFGVDGVAGTLTVVGAFALASVAGMVAFVLPGGIGAREVTLGLVLSTVLPGSAVVAVVALSRVLVTLADGLAAAVAAVAAPPSRSTCSASHAISSAPPYTPPSAAPAPVHAVPK